ncbi:uncharacterized protein [Spinacia oleracea]|uniref:Myb/SANT-like DNA-binding domain-containing protein n=1 Tax=Spinacia oleracea TaxID=3562 RepID=A0A9R0JCK3_SPIOL|nr:uncharacterized protein LOC110804265 [Spinacia oleracea]
MEGNGLSGRMYSNTGGVGILGLEMPLHTQPQNTQHHLQKPHKVAAFSILHHQQPSHEQQQQQQQQQPKQQQPKQQQQQHTQLSMKQPTNYLSYNNPNPNLNPNPNPNQIQNPCQKTKIQTQMTQLTNSDDDEPGCANDQENSSLDGKRKGGSSISPWQRMKWTDNMVRLLIMAVYYIGDEAGNEVVSEKKKASGGSGGGGGGGSMQKKGKWKSVSRAMMEKGFYVSPQQCEDKFNDLNKRYKRVNDILGRGTACRVVENQSLLDTMDILPKFKEEVRKLLNSKHLFFREMCAYHNSCGHGAGGISSEAAAASSPVNVAEAGQNHHHQQQSCLHSSAIPPNSHKLGLRSEDHEDDDDDEDDDEDDEDEFEDEEEEHEFEGGPRKRARTLGGILSNTSQALQQFNGEITCLLQDGSKKTWEKKQWMKRNLVKLEEQGLKYKMEALELEKQRLKWLKFSSKKEREMDKTKIDNERKRLENERMMLLLRQKEIELIGVEPQHPSNPSCISS